MLTFTCPHCSRNLRVKDELAGKKAKCPACGQPVNTPRTAAVSKDAAAPETTTLITDAEEGGPARKPESSDPPSHTAAESKSESNTQPAVSGAEHDWHFLTPPQEADEIGRLGSYRVLKVLGSGGMGVVFKAEDPQLKRMV